MLSRAATASSEIELKLALRAELVDRLFSNAVSIGAMGTLFTLFGLLVASRMGDPLLAGLVVAGGLAAAAHVAVVRLYRGAPRTGAELSRWESRYAAAGFGSAAFVGLAAARTFLSDDLGSAMLMTGLIFGYAAGTMARAATRPWVTAPRMLVLVAAPVAVLLSRHDLLFAAQALLLVLFLVTGLETMMSLHRQAVTEIDTSLRRRDSARRDALTGLANRLSLDEVLADRAAHAAAAGRCIAVHCLDLDGFKVVNDTHGHAAGDLLLQAVADRLLALVRPDDLVARLGGDEFVLVQAQVADGLAAERLAAAVVEALGRPYRLGDRDLRVSASVGVAVGARSGATPAALMAEADAALYASKARGRGRHTVRRATPPASHDVSALLLVS
ncbi:GGDEF domain-containing protein [Lichenibacterium dinghuense]|uniref:GGDEF domain-containing protein n=1 Tax=Lichenibacterium dinghuense TaxID=2895977 RepID=UPI001F3D4AF0|nr:GGDEF domain-containing protein [Lichenibacterium sp. 6Y81]